LCISEKVNNTEEQQDGNEPGDQQFVSAGVPFTHP
jgi:hypothetical protein